MINRRPALGARSADREWGPEMSRSNGLRPYIHGKEEPGGDAVTRVLHNVLPVASQSALRDYGFQGINDSVCALLAVPLSMSSPSLLLRFLQLGSSRKLEGYGPRGSRHKLHLFESSDAADPSTLLVFVHGGAWGSGRPWMYRLVADGIAQSMGAKHFCVCEYPVYPTASIVEQRDAILAALKHLRQSQSSNSNSSSRRIVLCGHSSGANISALALLEHVRTQAAEGGSQMLADAFVSLSGVFDIAKHYNWEKSRGVHIISPMGAAAGEPSRYHEVSPTLIADQGHEPLSPLFPATLVLHGADDATVPVTSS